MLVLCIVTGFLALQIRFEENITQSSANRINSDRSGEVIKNLDLSDKLIVDITSKDSGTSINPDDLVACGQRFTDSLRACADSGSIRNISFMASDTTMTDMMNLVLDHLPVFIEKSDFKIIDSLITPEIISKSLEKDFRILSSPASMVLKKRIQQDPLGISNIAFSKLKSLRADDNFELYNGCVFTKDLRHLLIFIVPAYPASETSRNDKLIKQLDQVIANQVKRPDSLVKIQYFGGTAVAVCNARQLKKDIILTLSIAVLLIIILLGWYFKNIKIPLMGMLPALFGGALALAVLFLVKGKISAISLGIGSVILGLIVDYSLYLVNHYRKNRDIELTLREMSLAIVLCCLTSAGAFLCLTFLGSTVLQDLGWFAAVSVLGAAFFTLLILPHFLKLMIAPVNQPAQFNFIDRMAAIRYERRQWLAILLLIAGVASTWFAGKVEFEKNMSALSMTTPQLTQAESDLDKISNYKLKNVYLVATGNTTEEALRIHDRLAGKVQRLLSNGTIQGVASAGALLTSDSSQRVKTARWARYWTVEKKQRLKETLTACAKKSGFRADAFNTFLNRLDYQYHPLTITELDIKNPMIADWLTIKPGLSLAPVILKVREANREQVYKAFPPGSQYVIFDRQKLTRQFIENVKHDFDLLVKLSMIFVTLLLIISFGRLGLGLMTALPMFFSWLITLGFMGITGTRFNIFNIIISSFIFGLGVDYSILMMRGLQHKLTFGKDDLPTYKVSILLSSLTTLIGVGVLFFTRHPALNSIALVSVVGIIIVVIVSFVFQPLIFNMTILNRVQQNKFPVTARIVLKTIITWGNIITIALILMILGTLINFLLPVKRKKKEMLFHHLFHGLTRAYIAFTFAFDRKLINEQAEDFTKPAIIISNHQSLIETPAFLRLYPKIIILTTSWVYRSPIFGPIARLANFYNVDNGIDSIMDLLREKVTEGFSIVIFPEAHRSYDQKIQRFHRGAFYLAEKLEIDILPVMVFGTGDFLPKGAIWGRPNSFRMKIFNRVSCNDGSFGVTYQDRAKMFRRWYIKNYTQFKAEEGDAHYYRRLLSLNYVMKGPVLEWYMRVKLRLENNYEIFNKLLPRRGEILDLGCGYGFISYMLMFTSDERIVTGVDYDEGKIAIARNCFSKNDRISFRTADVSEFEITPKNGFVLGDVLHYLAPEKQDELLRKCIQNLLPGGVILIREANSELESRHRRSRLTEFFSTRIGFNKTSAAGNTLHFTSAGRIKAIVNEPGLSMEVIDNKKVTSNNLFVIRARQELPKI